MTTTHSLQISISGDIWWDGFTAEVTLKNNSSQDLESWSYSFDSPHLINTTPWGAEITSVVLPEGLTRYTLSGKDWGASIPAGKSITVGFNGTQGISLGTEGQLTAQDLMKPSASFSEQSGANEQDRPEVFSEAFNTETDSVEGSSDGMPSEVMPSTEMSSHQSMDQDMHAHDMHSNADAGDYIDITSWGTFHGSNHNSEHNELVGGRTAITTEALVAYNGLRNFAGLEAVELETVGKWAFANQLTNNSQGWGNDETGVGLWYAMQGAKVAWIADALYKPQILADIQRTARLGSEADVMAMVREFGHEGFADYLETSGVQTAFINTLKMEPHYGGWMHGRTHGFLNIEDVAIAHDINHLTVLSWDQEQPFMNDTFDWPQWPALDVTNATVINYYQGIVALGDPLSQNLEALPSSKGATANTKAIEENSQGGSSPIAEGSVMENPMDTSSDEGVDQGMHAHEMHSGVANIAPLTEQSATDQQAQIEVLNEASNEELNSMNMPSEVMPSTEMSSHQSMDQDMHAHDMHSNADAGDYIDITSWGTFHGSNHNSEHNELVGGRTAITTEALVAYNGLRNFAGLEAVELETVGKWAFANQLTNNSQGWGNDETGVGLWYAMQGAKVAWIADALYKPQILADIQRTARLGSEADVMAMVREFGHEGFADYLETSGVQTAFINTLKMEPHYGGWMHGRTHGFLNIEDVAIAHDINHLTVLSWDQEQPFMNDTFDWPQWPALDVTNATVINYYQGIVALGDPLSQNLEGLSNGGAVTPDPLGFQDPFMPDPAPQESAPDEVQAPYPELLEAVVGDGNEPAPEASQPNQAATTAIPPENSAEMNGGLEVEVSGSIWWEGFTAELAVKNTGSADLEHWSFSFDSPHGIQGQPWGAEVTSIELANGLVRHTISGAEWGSSIRAGETIKVGFNGIQGHSIGTSGDLTEGLLFHSAVVNGLSGSEQQDVPNAPAIPEPQETISANSASDPVRMPSADQASYQKALELSLLFYEANRSGDLDEASNRIPWRGDSGLNDGRDGIYFGDSAPANLQSGVSLDLTGGYHDAGDHVKFGLPLASTLSTLAWGGIEFADGYQIAGQTDELLSTVKWGTDYLLKAHQVDSNGKTEFFIAQVGDGQADHALWSSPESQSIPRPALAITAEKPGSDVAAASAAALASASVLFRDNGEIAYADQLLSNAQSLFDFAVTYQGKYSDSIPSVQPFYNSWSGFQDELAYGGLWLARGLEAAGQDGSGYQLEAQDRYHSLIGGLNKAWAPNWDDASYGTAVMLAKDLNDQRALGDVSSWLDSWVSGEQGPQITEGGLRFVDQWGSLRYSANTAMLAGVVADSITNPGGAYSELAVNSIDYILGDNPRESSYIVGFGENSPQQPHHRAASGVGWDEFNSSEANEYVLYGALVGGPNSADDFAYNDQRWDYISNEVAIDYNSGLTGALAFAAQNSSEFG